MGQSLTVLRPAIETDMALVYATWFTHYKHTSPLGRHCRPDIFYPGQRPIINRILKQDGQVVVACPNDDSDMILGWLASEDSCIHYCYVKGAFRKMGIGKQLITSQLFKTFSHWTDDSEWAMKKFGLVYDPFKAMIT